MGSGSKEFSKQISLFSKAINRQYRQATRLYRSLPNFIIVGAQKAGTSSLYNYLKQHPQIQPSVVKEIDFFAGGIDPEVDLFEKGLNWYRSYFPLRRNLGDNQMTFEASPLYLFNPLAPRRIKDALPDVKLVVLLRNPTERSISHYFHEVRKGREKLPIMEALEKEEERLKPLVDSQDYKNRTYIDCSYKRRSLYALQLKRYLDDFDRGNIFICKSEDLFGDPYPSLEKLFAFLGVDSSYSIPNLKPHNVNSNRSAVSEDVYQYLDEYFRPHNQDLYSLLARDLSW